MSEGWPAVAWGQGPGLERPQRATGAQRPWALETEQKQRQVGGPAGLHPGAGVGWGGRRSSISTNPNYWGAPSLGREQVAILKKGWGLHEEFKMENDRWISTSQNNLEANPGVAQCTYGWRWRLKELGLHVRGQLGSLSSFPKEDFGCQ